MAFQPWRNMDKTEKTVIVVCLSCAMIPVFLFMVTAIIAVIQG